MLGVAGFAWREPCHRDEEEPSDEDKRREPEQRAERLASLIVVST